MNFEKQKVLAIFPQLPMPQFAGDRQKVNNHIKILSNNYQLSVVIICRTTPTQEDHDFLTKYCKEYKIFNLSKIAILKNLVAGVLRQEALQVGFFYSANIQHYINTQSINADFIFCNLIRVAKYAEQLNKPKFIDIVDSLSINYKRSLENVQSFFWKLIYSYEYKHLHNYEARIMKIFNASFLVNFSEQQFWQGNTNNKPVIWLPQGIKDELFTYNKLDNRYAGSIMFIGKMDYRPNIDAILWFIKYVWQHINQQVKFYIVGVNPPESLVQSVKNDARIEFMGYMEDPYLVMNSCAVVVSPMQTGGGVQNKILEGMALGKVNIATTLGAESIRFAISGKHLIVVDEPQQMAQSINNVLKNPLEYSFIGTNAKQMVTQIYTWKNFEQELISTINQLLSVTTL